MSSLSQIIIQAIRSVFSSATATLHEPHFSGNETEYVQECIDSTFVSSAGRFVDRFESELAEYTGSRYAVAVVNGSAALHIALLLAGVKPDDEVLVPTLTFVATANAVRYCGAVPHFVDCEKHTLGVDPRALREYLKDNTEVVGGNCINKKTGRCVRALVPVHVFGYPCDMDGVQSLAKDFHLVLAEDASESLGSLYHGQHTGTFGKFGTLSFNGNKIITTGGGGAILTQDLELATRAKHLTTTAKLPHRWEYLHDEVGFNYRLPNLNAALGCAQLEKMPYFLQSKRFLFQRYFDAFQNVKGVRLFVEPEGTRSNYWLQTLLLDEHAANQRDAILTATNDAGLMTRPVWTLLHQLPPYQDCPRMPLTVAESLGKKLINIPSNI